MSDTRPSKQILTVASEISNYLDKCPHASDTLDGVATWWLVRQRYESSREIVEAALIYLVDKGVVKSIQSKEKQIYYRKKDVIQ